MRRLGFDPRRVIDALNTVIPIGEIHGHHDADIGLVEQDQMDQCFGSGLISYSCVEAFEHEIASLAGTKFALATSCGTAALHLALIGLGVRQGDFVLVPSMSFVASANAIRHAGADPIFLDSEDDSFGLMPHKLEVFLGRETIRSDKGPIHKATGRRVAALMAVHVLGKPCRIGELQAIAIDHGMPLIEDAAEALGSTYIGRPCGSWGSAAVFSFNNNKIVTTNGGGALVTSSEALFKRARHLATTARVSHWFDVAHDDVAWNYRMPNVCAALGLGQLSRLKHILAAKKALAYAYTGALMSVPGIKVVGETIGSDSNRWLNAMRVDPQWRDGKEEIAVAMVDAAIFGRSMFKPLHTLPMYENDLADNPEVAADIYKRTICLPSGAALGRRFL